MNAGPTNTLMGVNIKLEPEVVLDEGPDDDYDFQPILKKKHCPVQDSLSTPPPPSPPGLRDAPRPKLKTHRGSWTC